MDGGGDGQVRGQSLAHGVALEGEPVGVVNQTIEDGVGERWIAEVGVPVLDTQLTGDQRGQVNYT